MFDIDSQKIDQFGALPGEKPAGLPRDGLQNVTNGLREFKQLGLELFLTVVVHRLSSSTVFAETLA